MLHNITEFLRVERRTNRGFALNLEVSVSKRRSPGMHSGRILDISSTGLRILAEASIAPGQTLDLAIAWPVLLGGRIPLRLIVVGTAVWSRERETAVRIQPYEFRTRRMVPVQSQVFRFMTDLLEGVSLPDDLSAPA